jgi:hypothetical protein
MVLLPMDLILPNAPQANLKPGFRFIDYLGNGQVVENNNVLSTRRLTFSDIANDESVWNEAKVYKTAEIIVTNDTGGQVNAVNVGQYYLRGTVVPKGTRSAPGWT